MRAILPLLLWLAAAARVHAGPDTFVLPNPPPPVIAGSAVPDECTVVWLVTDIATNDTIAVRMRIAPDTNMRPVNNVMPCPKRLEPRVALRALDTCGLRAGDVKDCVYADMGRDFAKQPSINNTAENSSRCSTDDATDIGIACFRSGEMHICGVGCGVNPQSAIGAAVSRCEAKHQKQCPITGSLPVLAPK